MIGFIWIVQIVILLICTTIMHLFGNCIVLFIFVIDISMNPYNLQYWVRFYSEPEINLI